MEITLKDLILLLIALSGAFIGIYGFFFKKDSVTLENKMRICALEKDFAEFKTEFERRFEKRLDILSKQFEDSFAKLEKRLDSLFNKMFDTH